MVEKNLIEDTKKLVYIVLDAELGRREIPCGIGEVQVCLGYYIERDPISGRLKDVPVYKTQVF